MVLIQIKHGITPLHTAVLNNNNGRVNNMDRSTYPLLSEREFVEIARRILAGEYNYQNGFYRDLADFLRTGGDNAMTQKQLHTRVRLFKFRTSFDRMHHYMAITERYFRASPGLAALMKSVLWPCRPGDPQFALVHVP